MARSDRAALGKRLYERFVAPLVLGGEITPGPGVGARAAFELDGCLATVDRDLRSRVDLARVRVARRLVGVDVLDEPDRAEWALAAALHDMVFALHPALDHLLHRSAADRLLTLAEQTIERVPPGESLKDELSRHTFFARALELQRTDTYVSWWTGSRTFLGTTPPPRLLAWPELRNVRTEETHVTLAELPTSLHPARRERFLRVLALWLAKVPLTDLATSTRSIAPFVWTDAALGLLAGPHGRVLGLRALALGPDDDVDTALGRATAPHVKAAAWENVARIGDVLAARAMAMATTEAPEASRPLTRELGDDTHFARALGAALALGRVDAIGVSRGAARAVTSKLMPLTRMVDAQLLADVLRHVAAVKPSRPRGTSSSALEPLGV
jgi:hypothetical protein